MIQLFWSYLRRHLGYILLLAAFAAVFGAILFLYRAPVEAVGYAAILCLPVGVVFFTVGFVRYARRHRALTDLLAEPVLPAGKLPEPRDTVEADYQQLLESFSLRAQAAAGEQAVRWRDMLDYFTLWAHQVKTPLAAMNLVVQQSDVPEGQVLKDQLFKMEQYVEMVLAYLRMDSDSTDFLIRPYPLESLVRQSVRKYAPLFIHKDIHLTLEGLEETVVTDEKWMCFALEQVLSNAIKYTPAGGEITVSAENGRLTVRDSGIGIAPEDLPRIFEKGFTGRNGRADKRASGIGLYLTHRIIRRLGHDLTVTSRLGEGTAVTFDLSTRAIPPV